MAMIKNVTERLRHETPWELMAAGMLSLGLVAFLVLLLVIGWQGLSYFWPMNIYQFQVKKEQSQEVFLGEIYAKKQIPNQRLLDAGIKINNQEKSQTRLLINIANKDREVSDFVTLLQQDILSKTQPKNIVVIERYYNGRLFGVPIKYLEDGKEAQIQSSQWLEDKIARVKVELSEETKLLQRKEDIQIEIEYFQQKIKTSKINTEQEVWIKDQQKLIQEEQAISLKINMLDKKMSSSKLVVKDRKGELISISILDIIDIWFPNQMDLLDKIGFWFSAVIDFISNDPIKPSEESGIFPAIFGTILMVILMSIMVMPLGVLAAVYLNEYAKKNLVTRLIRISVVNLAGVPSIVYGVFGLGFFVYVLGGNIDKLFYADSLPNPTFGTPGLLWSSLTLGLLTLPVVIVSIEDGLMRIPQSVRHASLALGATQSETLRRIVLPMASPALMTGLILAIARAVGEVAPLMLVGVVKLAQSLPLDGQFPYLHLDRKFMHLGYHIYDLSLQNANIEAIKSLVYATSLLLLLVVIGLNLTAIMFRNHLRERYRMLEPRD